MSGQNDLHQQDGRRAGSEKTLVLTHLRELKIFQCKINEIPRKRVSAGFRYFYALLQMRQSSLHYVAMRLHHLK